MVKESRNGQMVTAMKVISWMMCAMESVGILITMDRIMTEIGEKALKKEMAEWRSWIIMNTMESGEAI